MKVSFSSNQKDTGWNTAFWMHDTSNLYLLFLPLATTRITLNSGFYTKPVSQSIIHTNEYTRGHSLQSELSCDVICNCGGVQLLEFINSEWSNLPTCIHNEQLNSFGKKWNENKNSQGWCHQSSWTMLRLRWDFRVRLRQLWKQPPPWTVSDSQALSNQWTNIPVPCSLHDRLLLTTF